MRFIEKVVVITGAGSGIGKAMATLFAAEGARLVLGDLDAGRLEGVASGLREGGTLVEGVVGDVSMVADAEILIDTALEKYGQVDVLWNNAGIMDKVTPVSELSDELWRRVLGVNLDGPMYTSRKVLPSMMQQGSGVIINTASVGGLRGGVAGAAYTVAKHGLIGLTKNIAWQYAPKGVRCNAMCPGGVETAIGLGGEPNPLGWERMQPLLGSALRMGSPEEIARIAVFLASDEASLINGSIVVADAGWTAG